MKKTASISALIVAFSAIAGLAVLSTACGDDDTTGNTSSSSGGTSGATSGGTSGATSGGTSGATSGGTSGSTSSGGPTIDAVYTETCASLKKCTPKLFDANFADDAACAAYFKGADTNYTGEPTPDSAAIDKCTAALKGAECGAPLAEDCNFKGTNAKDAPCNSASQCSGGACTKAGTDVCGKCADAPAAPTPKKKGDTCTAGDVCEAGNTCQGPAGGALKCDTAKKSGETCSATNQGECGGGLSCVEGKCGEPAYAKAGEKCGLDGTNFILCGFFTHSCVDAKCVANAKDGEDCDPVGTATPTKPSCGANLTCESGKCKAVAECK